MTQPEEGTQTDQGHIPHHGQGIKWEKKEGGDSGISQ